ncbi:MAG: flagellar biosynthesis protein FlgI, partial [Planctomycetota bacterium]
MPISATQRFLCLFLLLLASNAVIGGCTLFRSDADEDSDAALQQLLTVPETPDSIGEATKPFGLDFMAVSGIGAVHDLPGTGGPAEPSALRDELISEMLTHSIKSPNQFLEADDTALVKVSAVLPPG